MLVLRSADGQRVSREVELTPPTPPPTKKTTASQQDKQKQGDLAKDNGQVITTLTEPKETDSKSKGEGDRKKENDPGLRAESNQDGEVITQEMEKEHESQKHSEVKHEPHALNKLKPTALKLEINSELSVMAHKVEKDAKTNAEEIGKKYEKGKDLDPLVKEEEGPQVESNSEALRKDSSATAIVRQGGENESEKMESKHEESKELNPSSEDAEFNADSKPNVRGDISQQNESILVKNLELDDESKPEETESLQN